MQNLADELGAVAATVFDVTDRDAVHTAVNEFSVNLFGMSYLCQAVLPVVSFGIDWSPSDVRSCERRRRGGMVCTVRLRTITPDPLRLFLSLQDIRRAFGDTFDQ